MNKGKMKISDRITWFLMAAAVLLVAGAFTFSRTPSGSQMAVSRTERAVEKRMDLLEGYIEKAFARDPDLWLDLGDVPPDIVIYRYVDDTLKSWSNQFTVMNDDISRKVLFERLSSVRNTLYSPLSDVGEETGFYNFGPKWYLAKSAVSGRTRVIAGLEILNTSASPEVNPHLKLDKRYSIEPLSYTRTEFVKTAPPEYCSNSILKTGSPLRLTLAPPA